MIDKQKTNIIRIQLTCLEMDMDSIFTWITSHPQNYPGSHQKSQPRTDNSLKPLDPKAQFHLIFQGMGEYIRQNMHGGRGINYRGFGAVAVQIQTALVKPAQLSNFDFAKELDNQRGERQHNHSIRPCFIPDKKLQDVLLRYPGKDQLDKPKSQHSVYQKGFNMIYCNPVPLAASCAFPSTLAQAILNSLARAVHDLTQLGRNMAITIGPLSLNINNRSLNYSYQPAFSNQFNQTQYEDKLKKSLKGTKEHWQDSYDDKWQKSSLSQMVKKPPAEETNQYYEKGLALKIMSLDLNTTEPHK